MIEPECDALLESGHLLHWLLERDHANTIPHYYAEDQDGDKRRWPVTNYRSPSSSMYCDSALYDIGDANSSMSQTDNVELHMMIEQLQDHFPTTQLSEEERGAFVHSCLEFFRALVRKMLQEPENNGDVPAALEALVAPACLIEQTRRAVDALRNTSQQ
eukprot:gnl/Trimastix_PCT/4762.p1 GENE.gnl/Trimastix_PCT/4762~~gnl/Trimastix_PCT/4762.p1  ORF type:complete len:159 (-),score=19.28 gnl/Trimastix_PCT/4762:15-491(-)